MTASAVRRLLALTGALVLAACALPADGPTVRLENGTTVAVAVHVNERWVGTYPAGAVAEVPIGGHGVPPLRITALSPTGAVLVDYTATEDDVSGSTGGGGEAVLPCGAIRLSVNVSVVELGPLHTPEGQPGPCP